MILSAQNVKEKDAIIDWSIMPKGKCDMDFRRPSQMPNGNPLSALRMVATTAFVGALLVPAFFIFAMMLPMLFGDMALLVTIIFVLLPLLLIGTLVSSSTHQHSTSSQLANSGSLAIVTVCGMVFIWGLIALLSASGPFVIGIAILIFVALPTTLRLADGLATHYISWMSANPRIYHRTMNLLRATWRHRFSGSSFLAELGQANPQLDSITFSKLFAARKRYPMVVLGCFLALPILLLFTTCFASWFYAGPLAIAVMASVVMIAVYAMIGVGIPSPKVFVDALQHWFEYAHDDKQPPWVFQSPCGGASHRKIRFVLPVIAWSVGVGLLWNDAGILSQIPSLEHFGQSGFLGIILLIAKLCLTSVVVPVLMVGGVLFIVTAPMLTVYHELCEAPRAPLRKPGASSFDGYADRLQHSANRVERNSLFLGYHTTLEYPILLCRDLLREHMHVLGATGGGKSALGMTPLMMQLIRRKNGPVIILDCKGDSAMLHTAMIEAKRAGKTFKWFTNRPNRSTYIFNPFLQSSMRRLTLQEITGLFMLSLNLHHGDDYGRAYFSIVARRLFLTALNTMRENHNGRLPFSFEELEEVMYRLATDREEFKAAQHLTFIIQSLSEFEQLNLSPHKGPHSALKHAIHMPEVIDQQQVIYFSLTAATDLASVAEIARLVVYSALTAATDHRERTGERPNVYMMIDEAQNVVAKNIENVLVQAREHGLACILSHQTMSQLNPPGGVDLRELVQSNTCVKQIFSVRDKGTGQYVSDMSGDVGYYDVTYPQLVRSIRQGNVGTHAAVFYGDDPAVCQVRQVVGPRLTAEDISDLSRHTNRCAVSIGRNEGYSVNLGAFPVHVDWVMPKSEYERRNEKAPWPKGGEATISVDPFWPESNDETIVAPNHPMLEEKLLAPGKLSELKKLLENQD